MLPKRTLRGTSDARRRSAVEDKKDTEIPEDTTGLTVQTGLTGLTGLTAPTNKLGPPIGLAVQEAREAREPQDQARRAGST